MAGQELVITERVLKKKREKNQQTHLDPCICAIFFVSIDAAVT